MKCKYCSGEVGLEERYCPYCGRPNEQAERHFKDMAAYRERYAKTEARVIGAAKRYAQVIPRVIVILLLLIATVVMAVIAENADSFPSMMRRRAAQRDPEGTIAVMEEYLAQRDYVAFASYLEYTNILTSDSPFEAYADIKSVAQEYKDVVLRMEHLFLHKDQEKWADMNASDDIRSLCQSIDIFFSLLQIRRQVSISEANQMHLDQMQSNVMDLLRVYLGIKGEEAERFLAMSSNRKAAFLEEVILGA